MGSPTSSIQKNVLESEWNFTRSVCSEIPGGEMLAGNAFCAIASSMLSSTGKYLREGINRRIEFYSDTSGSETEERSEKYVMQLDLINGRITFLRFFLEMLHSRSFDEFSEFFRKLATSASKQCQLLK